MTTRRTFSKHKVSTYTAHCPDADGHIPFADAEHAIWQTLYQRQYPLVKTHATEEFLQGLAQLKFNPEKIPDLLAINTVLSQETGFRVMPVPALIPDEQFFSLLAQRLFPAALFIRREDELDYLQEPDIFHEYFGHLPLLTLNAFADFTEYFGALALRSPATLRPLLGRLYWYTVEFGLIQTKQGLRCYGGGILSSYHETRYALSAPDVQRVPFDILTALRTPHRIDQLQKIYFVLNDFSDLYAIMAEDLIALAEKASALGDFPPLFNTDDL